MVKKASPIVRIAGIVSLILGVIFVVAGGTTWAMVTHQLKAENITVPADSDMFAGKPVAGPFTAYAQAQTINKHALKLSEGLTYAELGAKATEAKEAGDEEAAEHYTQVRTTAMNGSFLRASLFTSVVAYGVSALVIGLGLLQILAGFAFIRLDRKVMDAAEAEVAPAKVIVE